MEYLMTYGWAILIVIIVAAALYALGVFNPATFTGQRATGFVNLGVPDAGAWALRTNGQFSIVLKNGLPSTVTIHSIDATLAGSTQTNSTDMTIAPGGTVSANPLVTFGSQTSGSAYSVSLSILYTPTGGFNQTETGTVTGTATA